MKSINYLLLIFVVFAFSPYSYSKSDIEMGPIIKGYGPASAVSEADVQLPDGFIFKALFDVSDSNKKPDQYNRNIESVARFLNMHARNGVPIENMKLAVIIHGSAVKDVLTDSAYEKRHGIKNPNSELIKRLSEQGVEFYLCGQSAIFYDIKKEEISSNVELALSAMTMAVLLQNKGYHLIPF